MGIEPMSEAWEASGNRNFYHSIQAYVPCMTMVVLMPARGKYIPSRSPANQLRLL